MTCVTTSEGFRDYSNFIKTKFHEVIDWFSFTIDTDFRHGHVHVRHDFEGFRDYSNFIKTGFHKVRKTNGCYIFFFVLDSNF